ncbi:hypothetical protein RF11_07367 [Thelohanellus kitauei]|uniref:ISXO2-like transposase domain-containing protein n=1 Tax=Thelohanellus kitauei TaxID=669202 RepID=A0A0C2MG06_THEKT|nr:hypothetical protein RF11_07367 [Thelohanellus kitauei]
MEFCQKTCSANNVQEKWSNIKERMFLIKYGFLGTILKDIKIPMGGSYVGISSNRNRAVSVAFKKRLWLKKQNLFAETINARFSFGWSLDDSAEGRICHFLSDAQQRPRRWVVGMYDVAEKDIKIPMGGSYVGISSNRNRAVSVAFKKRLWLKKQNLFAETINARFSFGWSLDDSAEGRICHFLSDAQQRPRRWVVGMYDVAEKIGIVVCVPNRKAATLTEIIMRHVSAGSIIHTDGFACYKG